MQRREMGGQGAGPSQAGGYQGRSEGGYQGRSEGGYQGRSEGGYQGRSEGGYQGRPDGGGAGGPGGRGRGRDFRSRRKVCAFCVDHVKELDYKDVARLRRYLSDRGKIEPRRKTGTCARHQRRLGVALKNARHMALMPYTASQIRGL